jgi:hypothetical protein
MADGIRQDEATARLLRRYEAATHCRRRRPHIQGPAPWEVPPPSHNQSRNEAPAPCDPASAAFRAETESASRLARAVSTNDASRETFAFQNSGKQIRVAVAYCTALLTANGSLRPREIQAIRWREVAGQADPAMTRCYLRPAGSGGRSLGNLSRLRRFWRGVTSQITSQNLSTARRHTMWNMSECG